MSSLATLPPPFSCSIKSLPPMSLPYRPPSLFCHSLMAQHPLNRPWLPLSPLPRQYAKGLLKHEARMLWLCLKPRASWRQELMKRPWRSVACQLLLSAALHDSFIPPKPVPPGWVLHYQAQLPAHGTALAESRTQHLCADLRKRFPDLT